MGQPLLVVAKFTDGDYLKRLEGEGRGFSLRDSDSMDSSKNGGLSVKSIEKLWF